MAQSACRTLRSHHSRHYAPAHLCFIFYLLYWLHPYFTAIAGYVTPQGAECGLEAFAELQDPRRRALLCSL